MNINAEYNAMLMSVIKKLFIAKNLNMKDYISDGEQLDLKKFINSPSAELVLPPELLAEIKTIMEK